CPAESCPAESCPAENCRAEGCPAEGWGGRQEIAGFVLFVRKSSDFLRSGILECHLDQR
ncbi:MAG: hypothetical protein ACI8V5_000935, partial [Limisphaerales bacterium]